MLLFIIIVCQTPPVRAGIKESKLFTKQNASSCRIDKYSAENIFNKVSGTVWFARGAAHGIFHCCCNYQLQHAENTLCIQ